MSANLISVGRLHGAPSCRRRRSSQERWRHGGLLKSRAPRGEALIGGSEAPALADAIKARCLQSFTINEVPKS